MNPLTTLKETVRAEFEKELLLRFRPINSGATNDILGELDSLIDRTYHATKEEVRGIIKGLDSGMATVSNEAAYELCKQDILAALEDTTTSPTN